MDNCLLVFSEEKHCAAAPGKQDSLVFPVGEKTMKRRIGPACLSFLSKRAGPPGRQLITGLACFFGGRKDNGPTALPGGLACLFYLKESFPWELRASPIGGAEKTACLSFLSKETCPDEELPAGFGSGTKKPPTFLSGVLGRSG